MYAEATHEDLVTELNRLVGRPEPVVHGALSHVLATVSESLGQDLLRTLGPFPLTAWPALSPSARRLMAALGAAGLTEEEGLTALAVIDDHVRRRFGNSAWSRMGDWVSLLVGRYDRQPAPPVAAGAAVAVR